MGNKERKSATIRVPTDEPTIKAALKKAKPGDVIKLEKSKHYSDHHVEKKKGGK